MAKKNRQFNKQMTPEDENGEATYMRLEEAKEKLDFDAWHCQREAKIPKIHHKEIIKADFKGRGLGQYETMKDFDAALEKYGIKLA